MCYLLKSPASRSSIDFFFLPWNVIVYINVVCVSGGFILFHWQSSKQNLFISIRNIERDKRQSMGQVWCPCHPLTLEGQGQEFKVIFSQMWAQGQLGQHETLSQNKKRVGKEIWENTMRRGKLWPPATEVCCPCSMIWWLQSDMLFVPVITPPLSAQPSEPFYRHSQAMSSPAFVLLVFWDRFSCSQGRFALPVLWVLSFKCCDIVE